MARENAREIDISLEGVGKDQPSGEAGSRIDISLDGVKRRPGAVIDIPLDNEQEPAGRGRAKSAGRSSAPPRRQRQSAQNQDVEEEQSAEINRVELEMVNRHHSEVKELHRRASAVAQNG